jgi:purine-binding chemotaxis protein CheW
VQVNIPGSNSTMMGAMVDAVEEVVQLTQAELEATPDFGSGMNTQYILGVATIRGGVKTLLDIQKIFLEEGTIAINPGSKLDK